MADVGPKIEIKAFRDDFTTAKSDARAFGVRSFWRLIIFFESLEALAHDSPKHALGLDPGV